MINNLYPHAPSWGMLLFLWLYPFVALGLSWAICARRKVTPSTPHALACWLFAGLWGGFRFALSSTQWYRRTALWLSLAGHVAVAWVWSLHAAQLSALWHEGVSALCRQLIDAEASVWLSLSLWLLAAMLVLNLLGGLVLIAAYATVHRADKVARVGNSWLTKRHVLQLLQQKVLQQQQAAEALSEEVSSAVMLPEHGHADEAAGKLKRLWHKAQNLLTGGNYDRQELLRRQQEQLLQTNRYADELVKASLAAQREIKVEFDAAQHLVSACTNRLSGLKHLPGGEDLASALLKLQTLMAQHTLPLRPLFPEGEEANANADTRKKHLPAKGLRMLLGGLAKSRLLRRGRMLLKGSKFAVNAMAAAAEAGVTYYVETRGNVRRLEGEVAALTRTLREKAEQLKEQTRRNVAATADLQRVAEATEQLARLAAAPQTAPARWWHALACRLVHHTPAAMAPTAEDKKELLIDLVDALMN